MSSLARLRISSCSEASDSSMYPRTSQPPPVPLPAAVQLSPSTPSARPMNATSEQTVVTLEWHLTNLRAIFEGSKGDVKSRVIRSPLFGGGRWQVRNTVIGASTQPTERADLLLPLLWTGAEHLAVFGVRTDGRGATAGPGATGPRCSTRGGFPV
jgi:hypothetical protein